MITEEHLRDMSVPALEAIISNHIYEAALIFEQLEHLDLIYGNGHHKAQNIASYAVKLFQESFKRKQEVIE